MNPCNASIPSQNCPYATYSAASGGILSLGTTVAAYSAACQLLVWAEGMQTLTSFFANLSLKDPILWIVLSLGLIVLLVLVYLNRKPSRNLNANMPNKFSSFGILNDDWTASPEMPPEERRRAVRRAGMPTPIYVAEPKNMARKIDAYVLDRSSGGLRLAVQKAFPTGTALKIRPHTAVDDTPWINIIIRNCREIGDYYEVGCQFEEDLPWNILLLFG